MDIAAVAPDVVVDLRYAGSDNFLGRPARGYGAAGCLLTKPAARALAAAQRESAAFGLGLMVYDCYRPQRAVDDFVAWARDAAGPATNPLHHPVVPRSELFQRGYIAPRSGHSRGSTVDVTLIPAGPRQRAAAPPRDCRSIAGPLAPAGPQAPAGRWRRTGASTWGRRSTASTSARTRRTRHAGGGAAQPRCCCGR